MAAVLVVTREALCAGRGIGWLLWERFGVGDGPEVLLFRGSSEPCKGDKAIVSQSRLAPATTMNTMQLHLSHINEDARMKTWYHLGIFILYDLVVSLYTPLLHCLLYPGK